MGNSNSENVTSEQTTCNTVKSTDSIPRRCHHTFVNNEPIEPITIIWLDPHAKEDIVESLDTRSLLLKINNKKDCLFFDEIQQCVSAIKKIVDEQKALLIVTSRSFASEILLQMKTIKYNISTIIFCENYNLYFHFKLKWKNVIDICTEYEKLRDSIEKELVYLKSNLLNSPSLKLMRPLNSSNDFSINSTYFSYAVYIELIKQMPQTKISMNNMLKRCRDYYRDNKQQIEMIEEFGKTYTSNNAIDWYVKESFLYKVVNRAFRTEDITLWYLFRTYITDLCKQLEQVHKEQNIQTNLKLYRGQSCISTDELEYLKSNIGGLFATNGFLSTSKDFIIAESFFGGAANTDHVKPVIFEITVDGSNLQNTIFVDIERFNVMYLEAEVLFNMNSIFKIENIYYNENLEVHIIQMKATDEVMDKITGQIEKMKKRISKW
ncbi:unnamed protein product [Rotaria sp. Silwood1]|nr:unnamed protein product [Rotaria sp. Silwood1]CAF1303210.1 unnamed protein product [Rotaria sp. Silwood1]